MCLILFFPIFPFDPPENSRRPWAYNKVAQNYLHQILWCYQCILDIAKQLSV